MEKIIFYVFCCLSFWTNLSDLQAQNNIRFIPYQGKYLIISDSLKTLSADNAQLIYPVMGIISIDTNILPEDYLKIYVHPNQEVILNESYESNTRSSNFWLTTESSKIKEAGYYFPSLGTILFSASHPPLVIKINWYYIYSLLMIILITILLANIRRGRLFKRVADEENNLDLMGMTWLITALLATLAILLATPLMQNITIYPPDSVVMVIFGWLIFYFLFFIINWYIYGLQIRNWPKKTNRQYSKYAFSRLLGFIPLTLILIMVTAKSFWAAIPVLIIIGLIFTIICYKRQKIKVSNFQRII